MHFFARKPKPLPVVDLSTNWHIATALSSLHIGYSYAKGYRQQVCQYCRARGGFSLTHDPNCIIAAAVKQIFRAEEPKPPGGTP